MAATDGSWLPDEDVYAHLGVTDPAGSQAKDADRARLAATAYVERARPDLLTTDELGTVTYAADPDVVMAGLLLTARFYARKGSPTGLASFGEFGPGAILRLDPDVDRLLGIGRHARPRVG